jgi:tetratricopeptide (TPR) repeat protein
LAKEPKNCLAMMNLATSQIAVKGWKAAEGTLNKAIICDSKNPMAYSNLGFVLMKQKRLDESLKSYKIAYKMKPSASVKTAMEKVQGNIDVILNNEKMDEIAAANEQAKKDAEAAYQEELAKQEAYKRVKED